MPVPLTPELAERCLYLRAKGGSPAEISAILRLPYAVVRMILNAPTWPKVFTRIHDDMSWEIVRSP